MAITATMSATTYAQTALLYITYNLNGYSGNTVYFDLRVERPDIWLSGNTPAVQRYYFSLTNTGDGSITVPIYPLPENATIKLQLYHRVSTTYTFITEINITTGSIDTAAKYEDIPRVTSGSSAGFPQLLTEAEKQHNARIFFGRLYDNGWTDSAIASILAFADHYGGINPNINLKYMQPWALDRKPSEPWNHYFLGGIYYINNSSPNTNMQQFGSYYGNSGDNNEFLSPSIQTNPNSNYYGSARNAFLQCAQGINAIPSGTNVWSYIGGCMTFLPVMKQHYIDIFDRYLGSHWYATNSAFTIEQYLDYLLLYKDNREAAYDLFTDQSPLQDFTTFTVSTETPETLVMLLYNSLLNYKFSARSLVGYVCGDGKDVDNAEYWLPRLCRKWYDYIITLPHPKPHKKRKGMPIWEYLRYTI